MIMIWQYINNNKLIVTPLVLAVFLTGVRDDGTHRPRSSLIDLIEAEGRKHYDHEFLNRCHDYNKITCKSPSESDHHPRLCDPDVHACLATATTTNASLDTNPYASGDGLTVGNLHTKRHAVYRFRGRGTCSY